MSKCELLPKGCDCGSTEAAKCQSSKKPMKSREEIEAEIEQLKKERDISSIPYCFFLDNKINILKWCLNEI